MTTDDVRRIALDCIAEVNAWECANKGIEAIKTCYYIEGIRTMCEMVVEEMGKHDHG